MCGKKLRGVPLAQQIARYHENPSYTILKGFYGQQLALYWRRFDPTKIKVYLYDDLCADPIRMMQDVYEFLGVDASFHGDVSQRKQGAQVPKKRWVNQLLSTRNTLRATAAATLNQNTVLSSRRVASCFQIRA